jgi:ribosome maturation factor RimP
VTDDPLSPEALRAAVDGLGYELVDARVVGPASRRTIRLRIDVSGGSRPGAGVTTEDCQRVSRALESSLEGDGAVGPQYTLEVSSPGIERPLRFAEHWRRYLGREVRIKATGVSGRATARIAAVPDDRHVELMFGAERRTMPLEAIREATLVVDWSALG